MLTLGLLGALLSPPQLTSATARFETGRIKDEGTAHRIQGSSGSVTVNLGDWTWLAAGRAVSTRQLANSGEPISDRYWRMTGSTAMGWGKGLLAAVAGPSYHRGGLNWMAWGRIGLADSLQLVAAKAAPAIEPIPGHDWAAIALPLGEGRLVGGWSRDHFDRDAVSFGAVTPIGSGWRLSVGAGVSPQGPAHYLVLIGGLAYQATPDQKRAPTRETRERPNSASNNQEESTR